jgi:outer membrane protein insertion porin family
MGSATRRRERCGKWPAFAVILVALFSRAQALALPSAQQTTPAATPPQAPAKQSPGANEKPSGETAKEPGQIQLETPQTAPSPPEKQRAPEAPSSAVRPPAGEEAKPATIEDIIFRGNRRIPAATLRARIFTHKGDAYDENALERDFMALWNTGFLDDIRFEVSDGEQGKIITIFVREKKLVRSIDNKGLSTVSWSDALEEFKKRKIGLSVQSQYDPVVIKRAEVVLEEMLASHGRQFASVRARTRNIPPNSVALTFIVVEGPKVKVGNVAFQGNTVFSAYQLARSMKYSRPAGLPPWFFWFHKTYDKDRIQGDLENIRELYRSDGYFYALAKDPEVKTVDTRGGWPFFFFGRGRGKRVDIKIPIEEGVQYRLGKFAIRGNKLFKQEQLQPILQLKSGDIFDLSKVRKSIENYTKLYGQFGYINFTASPDIEPDNKRRLINLALDFEEDKQYFVHRIEFQGNTKTRDKVIRRELLLDEGALFSSTAWDYSTLRINQLGFFEPIKKEDYQIKQNPKEGNVDIIVKVKEKGRNSVGFQGGISGIAGNFVGVNYSTNNFLGLGETLSFETQFGTFQKLYSFGFTEPYLFDRPITTGFTIFKSDYHFDQLRQAAFQSGLGASSLTSLQNSVFGQTFAQNFQQNSSGFTVYASYPLHRSFARLGLTYSFSVSSVQAFSAASQSFFGSLAFGQFQGPNQLSGITTSQIMPTLTYNTVNNEYNPTSGKYLYAALSFSGSVLGGNVNTIRPVVEAKYFRPVHNSHSEKPNVIGVHLLASTISGFGGRVPPPFSRVYMGGENDVRGFDFYTISPIGFFPTVGSVCNRDKTGNVIPLLDQTGHVVKDATGAAACGSSTRFPYNTIQFPGGDTELLANFEYRIPIAGPVTLAYFIDAGTNFIWRPSQLKLQPGALASLKQEFPNFPTPTELRPVGATNFRPRSSTGLELQLILPIVNMPFRIYYGYNWLRLNDKVLPPQDLPSCSIFPNQATCNAVQPFFQAFPLRERKAKLGFTVARTF